ncbi:MAG: hypothetical protein PHX08_01955 [Lachnospiraceae bacterium]|nr:hypothetical protein [Lachnospiraceae bacterium]
MEKLEEVKNEYWKILSRTRNSGRISQSVKEKSEEKWSKFDEDVIIEALHIHMNSYKSYKESYTIGIMRNLQKTKDSGSKFKASEKNQFNAFQQNEYDFDQLEREILSN